MLYKTTNGGINWLFEIPDTSFGLQAYGNIQFINKNIGWANSNYTNIHTTSGGDTVWYTGLQQISNKVPKQYRLYQNYPNPFNPKTTIKYEIIILSEVSLTVFDIQGKEIITLVNERQSAGAYNVDFSGNGLSSGIYFYSLLVDNKLIDTKKMILIK